MDIFANLLLGLSVAVTPANLAYLFAGVLIGMVVGIIPGFGPAAALAILLPVTFGMSPNGAVIMLAAIYYGSQYGGTITSILLNTPGESSSIASTMASLRRSRSAASSIESPRLSRADLSSAPGEASPAPELIPDSAPAGSRSASSARSPGIPSRAAS